MKLTLRVFINRVGKGKEGVHRSFWKNVVGGRGTIVSAFKGSSGHAYRGFHSRAIHAYKQRGHAAHMYRLHRE